MTLRYVDKSSRVAGLIERRSGADRRRRRLPAFFRQFLHGRRAGERRLEHGPAHHYVDLHGPGLLLVILVILLMCVADAYLTLTLLNDGAVEVNPVMRAAIAADWKWFFYSKYVATACSLIILLMHKNYRVLGRVSGQHILFTVLLLYACLISYEIRLFMRADLFLLG